MTQATLAQANRIDNQIRQLNSAQQSVQECSKPNQCIDLLQETICMEYLSILKTSITDFLINQRLELERQLAELN